MKLSIAVAFLLLGPWVATIAAAPQPADALPKPPAGKTWKLVWNDEFDGPTLDASKWTPRPDGKRKGGWWSPRAISLDGQGHLVIKTFQEGDKFLDGCITTQGKFERAFGYYVARIRLQQQPGHWSAFWITGSGVTKVGDAGRDGTEIDIMEKPWLDDRVQHTFHWDGYAKDHQTDGKVVRVPGVISGFHTFAVWWTPQQYIFYVDGHETWRTAGGGPAQVPEYMLLSDEIGTWAGDIARAKLPDAFEVDYVRVYDLVDRKCSCPGLVDKGIADKMDGEPQSGGESTPRANDAQGILDWIPQLVRLSQNRYRTQIRLLGLAALVGVVAGLGAIVFYVATRAAEHYALGLLVGYSPEPRPGGEATLSWLPEITHPFLPWLLLIVPTVGGLISGWLVFTVAPEAEGHGTDSVIAAYHQHQGQIRPRVPLVKIVASSITLGTGGSGGREGPIAQIGAGFGSLLGNLLHLRPAERRVLMAAGMGAGIGAIFRAPLAGTIFAGEVLYSSVEFEPEVIIPAGIASVISYCIYGVFSGWEPLFTIPELSFNNPWQLGPYLLLALFMALLAALYTHTFYGCQAWFHRLALRPHFKPAIGAFLTGVVALGLYLLTAKNAQVLAVLAFGYSAIQNAMTQDAGTTAGILLAVALGKIITTGLTIGSGGSGGVFGPSMVIGGCGGGALGVALHHLWPGLVPHPASFVVVGMAGFFAAAAKTPFSTLIIVSEMTGGYQLLLPSLWVCTLAFVLSDRLSIYSSQVEGRSLSPAHQGSFVRQVLAQVRVGGFLTDGQTLLLLRPHDSLATVTQQLSSATGSVLPVTDNEHRLLGVVTIDEIYLATQASSLHGLVLAEDLMRGDVRPLTPDDTLDRALELFVENDLLTLPVVTNLTERRVVGMVSRFDISSAYLRRVQGPTRGTPG